jgi:hypothetical protein
MAITPIMVWNPPSHLATFAMSFPIAGMLVRMPIANINPATIATMLCNKSPKYSIPKIMAITPIMVWNLPSHLATFSKLSPIAGMLGRMPIASISPATIFTISIINALSPLTPFVVGFSL